MDTLAFWQVIGNYNQSTIVIQFVLLILLVVSIVISILSDRKYLCKVMLGILHLHLAIVYFAVYGTEPVQKYFALPLFLACGLLFLYDGLRNKTEKMKKPDAIACVLGGLYILYPIISMLFGAEFPQMVTYIMPCPVVVVSIVVYSCYQDKNRILLLLLTIWGLTGVKSVVFHVYEDTILLFAGLYGLDLMIEETKNRGEMTGINKYKEKNNEL